MQERSYEDHSLDSDLDFALKPGLAARVLAHLARTEATPECIQYVSEAMRRPARNQVSGARNVSGRYPSSKVGATVGFESRTLELAGIYSLEHDEQVLLYVDQPPALKFRHRIKGRMKGYVRVPDFVVIRGDNVIVVECKRLAELQEKARRSPELYVEHKDGWSCPPGIEAARELGMQFEVWTEKDFSPTIIANLAYLEDYLQSDQPVEGYETALESILGMLRIHAQASLADILSELAPHVCVDHLNQAIALGDVAVDIENQRVLDQKTCMAYRCSATMNAFIVADASNRANRVMAPVVHLESGSKLLWDGKPWQVLNVGASQVTMSNQGKPQSLALSVVEDLIKTGVIKSAVDLQISDNQIAVSNMLATATAQDLKEANRRHALIMPYLTEPRRAPSSRTHRRYLASYRQAEISYGNGFVGLLPKTSRSGCRTQRLRQDVLDLVQQEVNERLLTPTNINLKTVWGFIASRCTKLALPTPSYAWFCGFVKKIPTYVLTLKRGGSKLAYKHESRVEATDLAEAMEPVRPWERVHIDHTVVDVETIFEESGETLGRPWLTVMIDHVSRRILGMYLTYDPPSYRSVLGAMRDCVRRFGRLPETMVVDGGKEFRSVWFETTCALYKTKVMRRPGGKPRYGSQIERFFGTLNTTLFHHLQGNTQLTKNVRQMTDEVSPHNLAIWTFSALFEAVNHYMYEVYDNELKHRTLLMTPRRRYLLGMDQTGQRPQRFVSNDNIFRINTCPSTAKGTARVQADGVKINYLYYDAPELQSLRGHDVHVRYDPDDMATAYAHVKGCWIILTARNARSLRGRTEREILLYSNEWRRCRSVVEKERLTDAKLIEWLQRVDESEMLLQERKRAAVERAARLRRTDDVWESGQASVDGGLAATQARSGNEDEADAEVANGAVQTDFDLIDLEVY